MTSTEARSEQNTAADLEDAPPAGRQYGTLVEVVLDTGGADPEVFTVHVLNPDRIRYEKTAAKHPEWPSRQDGGNFATAFLTWAAARRTGQTSMDFDRWESALLDYDEVKAVPADPTR